MNKIKNAFNKAQNKVNELAIRAKTAIFIRMGYMKENCVQLISVTSPEFQYGAADTISYFGKVEQIIPYSQALKEQYVSGNLTEVTKDKKYAAVLEAVRQKVVK